MVIFNALDIFVREPKRKIDKTYMRSKLALHTQHIKTSLEKLCYYQTYGGEVSVVSNSEEFWRDL